MKPAFTALAILVSICAFAQQPVYNPNEILNDIRKKHQASAKTFQKLNPFPQADSLPANLPFLASNDMGNVYSLPADGMPVLKPYSVAPDSPQFPVLIPPVAPVTAGKIPNPLAKTKLIFETPANGQTQAGKL